MAMRSTTLEKTRFPFFFGLCELVDLAPQGSSWSSSMSAQGGEKHDCCYLPTDPFRGCNMGFAFLNFTKPEHIVPFFRAFQGMRWSDTAEHRYSTKVCDITYARTQGSAKVMKMCDHPAQPQPADGPRSRVEQMNRKWQRQQALSSSWGLPMCVVPQYAQTWA
mmetsp:Transcript_83566/g.190634  ORF Transcript_83566/g.190634 Transcript_83566/m.190634 type:complete len:163 (-) Transcript_83566:506-994(-)